MADAIDVENVSFPSVDAISNKVLLDIQEAENIFQHLQIMFNALTELGTTPKDRSQLVRGMVKIKVAINKAKGLYD